MKVSNHLAHLKKHIQSHSGMDTLKRFGNNLLQTPLNPLQLKIFMATLWAFYKETPSGILHLALRVSDFWRDINPWDANAKAAHILYACYEEFGLQALGEKILPTHHQLFLFSSHYFGVTENDLKSNQYILKAGTDMGNNSRIGYREKSIPFGLGYHLASELTSWWEFKYFYEGILEHKTSYNIEFESNPALKFFHIHTLAEPEHLAQSENIVSSFINLSSDPYALDNIYHGAEFYMKSYYELFKSLNQKIY